MTKEETMSTPQHCPGYENFRNLKSFTCKCADCGAEAEIFSDEFNRTHLCKGCGKQIDFTACELTGEAKSSSPR
jgi:hypothetical protein